jgi:hypothetical protein
MRLMINALERSPPPATHLKLKFPDSCTSDYQSTHEVPNDRELIILEAAGSILRQL